MKIRLERNGTVFEYEHQPMKEGRFRALCVLAGAAVYAGLVIGVAALCGEFGLLLTLFGTALVTMVVKGFE